MASGGYSCFISFPSISCYSLFGLLNPEFAYLGLVLQWEFTLCLYTLKIFHTDVCDFHSERQEVHVVISIEQAVQHYSASYGEFDFSIQSYAIFPISIIFSMSKPLYLIQLMLKRLLPIYSYIIMQTHRLFFIA